MGRVKEVLPRVRPARAGALGAKRRESVYFRAVQRVVVEGAALLPLGESRVVEVEIRGRSREAFVLRTAGGFSAFLNECPHWAVELDLGDGHFYDPEMGRIYCKNHGALFHPTTGMCETGPCLGRSLERFETEVHGGDVVMLVPTARELSVLP